MTETTRPEHLSAGISGPSAPAQPVQVTGLLKRYGDTIAVAGVTFEVRPGQIFGLLGRNGAGKTTTLEVITGLTSADEGTVAIFGESVGPLSTAGTHLGYSPQPISVFQLLTVRENVTLMARLRGMGDGYEREVDGVLNALHIASLADRQTGVLSGGEQRRVQLAMATVHKPRLLILDEPTSGVDVETRHIIQTMLRRLQLGGTAVLYTTHYLEEAERLCDYVAIMDAGEIVAAAPLAELLADRAVSAVDIVLESEPRPETVELLLAVPQVLDVDVSGPSLRVRTDDPSASVADIVGALPHERVVNVGIVVPSLEAVFLDVVSRR